MCHIILCTLICLWATNTSPGIDMYRLHQHHQQRQWQRRQTITTTATTGTATTTTTTTIPIRTATTTNDQDTRRRTTTGATIQILLNVYYSSYPEFGDQGDQVMSSHIHLQPTQQCKIVAKCCKQSYPGHLRSGTLRSWTHQSYTNHSITLQRSLHLSRETPRSFKEKQAKKWAGSGCVINREKD